MTTALEQLRNLAMTRKQLNERLEPLNQLMAQKQSELARLRSSLTTAESNRDAAIERSATVAGMQLLGAANADAAREALKARAAAETAFADAQASQASIHALTIETAALQSVGAELAMGLVDIESQENALREKYLRQLADDAAAEYATVARELSGKLATVLAYQQALAAANLNPDLLTGGVWNFGIPSLNSPSASHPAGGLIVGIETARQQQPKAFADIRARISADGVSINGL